MHCIIQTIIHLFTHARWQALRAVLLKGAFGWILKTVEEILIAKSITYCKFACLNSGVMCAAISLIVLIEALLYINLVLLTVILLEEVANNNCY